MSWFLRNIGGLYQVAERFGDLKSEGRSELNSQAVAQQLVAIKESTVDSNHRPSIR